MIEISLLLITKINPILFLSIRYYSCWCELVPMSKTVTGIEHPFWGLKDDSD